MAHSRVKGGDGVLYLYQRLKHAIGDGAEHFEAMRGHDNGDKGIACGVMDGFPGPLWVHVLVRGNHLRSNRSKPRCIKRYPKGTASPVSRRQARGNANKNRLLKGEPLLHCLFILLYRLLRGSSFLHIFCCNISLELGKFGPFRVQQGPLCHLPCPFHERQSYTGWIFRLEKTNKRIDFFLAIHKQGETEMPGMENTTYDRGKRISLKRVENKKVRTQLKHKERKIKEAVERATEAETLLPDTPGFLEAEGLERTYKFRQSDLLPHVDLTTAEKAFSLDLPSLGPYAMDFTRNGRQVLLGGRKGHIATFDWRTAELKTELQLNETVRDVKYSHLF